MKTKNSVYLSCILLLFSFFPQHATANANNYVTAPMRWLDNGNIAIDFLVNVEESKPVFGAAINLLYDNAILEYNSYEKGVFFDSSAFYLVSDNISPDNNNKNLLVIGVSLFSGTPGAVGSGKLITINFEVNNMTPTEILFNKRKLKNSSGEEIPDITWPDFISIACFVGGDADIDGDVDIDDVFCLFKHVMGRPSCLDNVNNPCADVDQDGDVDIDDVFCLFKKVMGRPSCLDGI